MLSGIDRELKGSIVLMLLLSLSAFACEDPLEVRTVYPQEGTTDVPLNARLLVSFIGWGSLDEYSVKLTRDGGQIATTENTWCYDHEGPYEVHCWIRMFPEELLEAETTYTLKIETTDDWPHDGFRSTSATFTTGSDTLKAVEGTPGLEVIDVWTEKEKECGFDIARRYWLGPQLLLSEDESGASVFHLYSLDEHGEPGEVIHTVFSGTPSTEQKEPEEPKEPKGLKQYLNGSKPQTDCFRLIEEDGAGNRTPYVDACAVPDDTGDPDSGSTDSGSTDSGSTDSGSTDSGSTDSASPETGTPDTDQTPTVTSDPECGCSGSEGWIAVLLPLIVWRTSRGTG